MAYDQALADRIREALVDQKDVEEKEMFGGICFMVNGKMCAGVMKDELMCRIDPASVEQALEKPGCRAMKMGAKTMKGYVLVGAEGIRHIEDFSYWISLCLEFNPKAKASVKTKRISHGRH